ncbi:hypothetical protein MCOR02_004198 [Pyricularia oryzae]|nr:hypothetical protein MCOR02_004198 [Pyricularia oryzae]
MMRRIEDLRLHEDTMIFGLSSAFGPSPKTSTQDGRELQHGETGDRAIHLFKRAMRSEDNVDTAEDGSGLHREMDGGRDFFSTARVGHSILVTCCPFWEHYHLYNGKWEVANKSSDIKRFTTALSIDGEWHEWRDVVRVLIQTDPISL